MARQNTFTIVPQVPRFDADTATPARPMTSKQVRKAYKASTKTPTMTRAERIKWEREEQERIKKDYEKERTAAKARAAREKKKEKEMQQREEKRRNGLPLVNVRPSQDTIARFVRGNGSMKKRDAEGAVVTKEAGLDEPSEGNYGDKVESEAEPAALGSILEAEEVEDGNEEETSVPKEIAVGDESPVMEMGENRPEETLQRDYESSTPKEQSHATTPPVVDGLEEVYGIDPGLEEPIDEDAFDVALDLVPEIEHGKVFSEDGGVVDTDNKRADLPESLDEFAPSQDLLDEDINTDMLEELDELLSGGKISAKQPPVQEPTSPQDSKTTPKKQTMGQATPESVTKDRSTTPQREKKAPLQRMVRLASSSPAPPRPAPPMGTQAILVNFDHFFPTSSQQRRELDEEEETIDAETMPPSPRNSNKDALTATRIPEPVPNAAVEIDEFESDFGSFPSTAHLSLIDCSMAPRQTPQIHIPAASACAQPISKAEPPPPSTPRPQPSRFFTSSGSREQLSLALQRSRRSAALEQIQEKERQRQEAGHLMRQSKYDEAVARRRAASPPTIEHNINSTAFGKASLADKENLQPEMKCSQETEYGGDWVEDAAWDVALC
ncbi:hypothetical protein PWT90_08688 [Aphanocladium album]|nr:hypothetical protein PWT90_08688 [Aphanocladium album]